MISKIFYEGMTYSQFMSTKQLTKACSSGDIYKTTWYWRLDACGNIETIGVRAAKPLQHDRNFTGDIMRL
jgi:hypothetical protein